MSFQEPVPGIPGAIARRVAQVPDLPDACYAGPHTVAMPGQLLFTLPGTGRFLSRDGALIEFAPEAGADQGMVKLFLNGTARGALIHQRGELPLHAATLVPPHGGGAIAICGFSGAGKSTLAAELSRRGWLLVADDTTRVTWDGARALAWPSRDSIKLWRDACEAAGLACSMLERVTLDLDKYYVRVPALDEAAPLATIVELVADAKAGAAASAGERMALLSRNTYRPKHILPLGMQKQHVQILSQVASVCSMLQLCSRSEPAGRLADKIEAMLR